MKLVIVENEIRIREGICKLILKMKKNYEVIGEADNGKEGLKLIQSLKPDIVITDIRMPVMDGLQMLEELSRRHIKVKAIVLSAYSEFTYAQKAITLGVSEYLLKPIVIGDFARSLQNIETQCEMETAENSEIIDSLETILAGLLYGSMKLNENLKKYLKSKYDFCYEQSISEVMLYLGKSYSDYLERTKQNLNRILLNRSGVKYCFLEFHKEKAIIIVLYNYQDAKEQEKWFQNELFMHKNINIPTTTGGAWITMDSLDELKASHQILQQSIDWTIILGNDVMISYPKILQVQTMPCIYPIEKENKLKVALCTNEKESVHKILKSFTGYFHNGNVYEPKEVKESFVRFLWSAISIVKEIGKIDSNHIKQQELLENIMNAKTFYELEDIMETFYQYMIANTHLEHEDTSLMIAKAQRLIHEFYQVGITLEEIADKLNVTPEYLGMQFHRETGMNFTHYIKECRIRKAKELLITTQLKLNRIAKQVGYTDAKYFSRVFREETRMLPTEFRKIYR